MHLLIGNFENLFFIHFSNIFGKIYRKYEYKMVLKLRYSDCDLRDEKHAFVFLMYTRSTRGSSEVGCKGRVGGLK